MGQHRSGIPLGHLSKAVTLLASYCLLGGGCSSDDESSKSLGQAVSDWCSARCSWQQACGNGVASTCMPECRTDGGFAAYGRLEFYVAMTNCLKQDSACTGGADASWQACAEAASLQTPLSQSAFDFCESMGKLFFECGYGGSPTTCARNYISFTDDVLADIAACGSETCDMYMACIQSKAYGGA